MVSAPARKCCGYCGDGACAEVSGDLMRDVERVRAMRDRLIKKGLTAAIPGVRLNGDPDMRLPGNVNVSIDGVSG